MSTKKGIDIIAEYEFGPFDSNITHLNHAGISPLPKRTRDAIHAFVENNTAAHKPAYGQWAQQIEDLRDHLQVLINARSADEIAFVKNTSEGLSMVAYGMDWHKSDNIVFGQQEFPSNRIVWEAIGQQYGVELRCVDLNSDESPEQALTAHIDAHTRLLAVSSVQYGNGYKMDLKALGDVCHSNDTLFCIDAIQSFGIEPLDVQAIGADFVFAGAHKWLLSLEGAGIFYCNAKHLERLQMSQMGWASVSNNSDYDALFGNRELFTWTTEKSARRFESGTLNTLGINALSASLNLLCEVGITTVKERIAERTDYIAKHLDRDAYQLLSPEQADKRAGIITFKPRSDDPQLTDKIFRALISHGFLCAKRAGGIRFSPHFYTPLPHLQQALNCLP